MNVNENNDNVGMHQLIEELHNQRDFIQQLQGRIDQLTANQAQNADSPAGAPPRMLKFPDPGKFDGLKPHAYPQWKRKVQAKLEADFARLGSPSQQSWYIFSMLDSPASDRAEPWMTAQEAVTPELLLAQLDYYYLDPSLQKRASQKLNSSKQGNQPLAIFLAKFDQLLLEAGGARWPDMTKITLIRNAVRQNLLMFLIGRPPSRTYEEFKQCLRDVDTNYSLLMNGNSGMRFGQRSSSAQTPFGTVHANRFNSEPAPVPANTHMGSPMELDSITANRTRASWVSSEEIEERRVQGLCLRCGAIRHRVRQRPYAPAIRPRPQQPINVQIIEDEEVELNEPLNSGLLVKIASKSEKGRFLTNGRNLWQTERMSAAHSL